MKSPVIRAIICVILLLAAPAYYFINKSSGPSTQEYYNHIIEAQGNVSSDALSESSTWIGSLYINTSDEYFYQMGSETGINCFGYLQLTETPQKKSRKNKENTETYYITSAYPTDNSDNMFYITLNVPQSDDYMYGIPLEVNSEDGTVSFEIQATTNISSKFILPLINAETITMEREVYNKFYFGENIYLPLFGGISLKNYVAKFYGDSSSLWIVIGLYISLVTAIYFLLWGKVGSFFMLLAGIVVCAVTAFMSWTIAVPLIIPFFLFCIRSHLNFFDL